MCYVVLFIDYLFSLMLKHFSFRFLVLLLAFMVDWNFINFWVDVYSIVFYEPVHTLGYQ